MSLYERLINDGIVAADSRSRTIDHLTARRVALWLTARPQEQVFAQMRRRPKLTLTNRKTSLDMDRWS